ncbi:unnamed protein product [Acanthosepion pharaonis]|uniref:Uncharacterized protein n=1 Tax=Acanthosepion pharaonis TaxID=158019 RepID=A0A812B4R5_ACAPH|nr:unnamed protein product [Sepia pharaonis]
MHVIDSCSFHFLAYLSRIFLSFQLRTFLSLFLSVLDLFLRHPCASNSLCSVHALRSAFLDILVSRFCLSSKRSISMIRFSFVHSCIPVFSLLLPAFQFYLPLEILSALIQTLPFLPFLRSRFSTRHINFIFFSSYHCFFFTSFSFSPFFLSFFLYPSFLFVLFFSFFNSSNCSLSFSYLHCCSIIDILTFIFQFMSSFQCLVFFLSLSFLLMPIQLSSREFLFFLFFFGSNPSDYLFTFLNLFHSSFNFSFIFVLCSPLLTPLIIYFFPRFNSPLSSLLFNLFSFSSLSLFFLFIFSFFLFFSFFTISSLSHFFFFIFYFFFIFNSFYFFNFSFFSTSSLSNYFIFIFSCLHSFHFFMLFIFFFVPFLDFH